MLNGTPVVGSDCTVTTMACARAEPAVQPGMSERTCCVFLAQLLDTVVHAGPQCGHPGGLTEPQPLVMLQDLHRKRYVHTHALSLHLTRCQAQHFCVLAIAVSGVTNICMSSPPCSVQVP